MKSEFPPGFSNKENIGECLFRRSVCFRNFPLKCRKQRETELMVSLAKHQSVFLVCFNGSYIESCSSFMIHTRCHTSIQAPLWHPPSFFSVLRARKGKNFEKNYCTNTQSKIFNCFKEICFYKPNGIVQDDLIRTYPAMQKINSVKRFFFLFIYHFLREIACLKLNKKVCDAIPGTLYVVSE